MGLIDLAYGTSKLCLIFISERICWKRLSARVIDDTAIESGRHEQARFEMGTHRQY